MKNKGFTLVELLGTIILLAVIALIALPAILNALTTSQAEIDSSYKDAALAAARTYVNDNMDSFPKALESATSKKEYGNQGNITVQFLLNEGYLTDSSINAEDTCEMMNDYIKVTSDSKKYIFEYNEVSDEGVCEQWKIKDLP